MKCCPHCGSFGVLKIRRSLWRRLARRPHTCCCIDCGARFSRQEGLAAALGQDASPPRKTPAAPALGRHRAHLAVGARRARRLADLGADALEGLLQRIGLVSIEVWVVKQVDADILHLCGIGRLQTEQRPWAAFRALKQGRYQGGVRLGRTGFVFNSRLFATLIPLDELHLEPASHARWQGRDWQIAQVPERSWHHPGRLIAQRVSTDGQERLISSEDVSNIREHIAPDAAQQGTAVFRPGISRCDPILSAYRTRERRRRRDS